MDAVWKQFREIVEYECGLMGNDCLGHLVPVSAPQCQTDEIIMFVQRNDGKAVKAMIDSLKISGSKMIFEVRVVITNFLSLLRREVSPLPLCERGKCSE